MSNFLTTDKEKFSNPLLDLLNKSLKKSENNGSTLPQIPQLNSSVLKSKSEQPKYISDFDLKFESFSSYTPTSLLRFLDKIKNYTPSQAEIEEFSLSSSQRYSLNNIKLFLILCGGLIGNSFSSNEMTNSINLINSFSKNFSTLESIYHKLTLTEKKLKYSLLQKLLSQEIPEDVSPEFKDLSRESLSKVNNFFDLSKEILVCLEKILSFIKEKRQNFERVEKINNGTINADPEKVIGSLYPLWFNALYLLWERSENFLEEYEANKLALKGSFKQLKVHSSFSLKKFAFFLKKIKGNLSYRLSEEEQDALYFVDSAIFSIQSPSNNYDLPADISAYIYFFLSVPEIRKFKKNDL